MDSSENHNDKSSRRDFFKKVVGGTTILSGIPLLYWSPLFHEKTPRNEFVKDGELRVLEGLMAGWCDGWQQLPQEQYLKNLNQVMAVIRADKIQELSLALKLLSYPPSCLFLTGFLTPWRHKEKVLKILKKWQYSDLELHKKLYFAFSSIFSAALYSDPKSWQAIGYPGPPEIDRTGI